MQMHPLDRVNGWLALAALTVALLLWLGRPASLPPPPITPLDAADINAVQLYEQNRLKWSVLRDKAGWTMTHPDITAADPARIAQLLSIVATPSLRAWQGSPETLAAYGLAAPAYRLVFDKLSIDFGATEPTAGLRYILVGDRVHLIGDGYYHHLLAATQSFHRAED